MKQRLPFTGSDVAALSVVLVWSGSYSVIKLAYDEFTPLAYTLVRFALASVLLLAICLRWQGLPRMSRRGFWLTVLVGILCVGFYQIMFSLGLLYTTASSSALLIGSAPIYTALFARLFRVDDLRPLQAVGILAAFGGVALLVLGGGGEFALSGRALWGDLLTLVASVSYGASVVVAQPLVRRYGALPVMTVAMAAGTLIMAPWCLGPALAQDWRHLSTTAWLQLAYGAVPAGALAYFTWYAVIGRLGSVRVAAYNYLIPVGGVALAVGFLGENLTDLHLLGATVILAGVALTRWGGGSRRGKRLPLNPAGEERSGAEAAQGRQT